jgi:hypothetical protein
MAKALLHGIRLKSKEEPPSPLHALMRKSSAESRFSETLRLFLDRFHYTRDSDWETGEYDRRPRRGGIEQEEPGGEQKAESVKRRAESRDQMFFILTPDS